MSADAVESQTDKTSEEKSPTSTRQGIAQESTHSSSLWTRLVLSFFLIAAIGVFVGGVGFLMYKFKPKPKKLESDNFGTVVKFKKMEYETIQEFLTGYGVTQALTEADIAAEVRGQIIDVREGLHVGASVVKGEILCRIDPSDYQEELKRREGLLDQAKAELRRLDINRSSLEAKLKNAKMELSLSLDEEGRLQKLVKDGVVSQSELDRVSGEVKRNERTVLDLEQQFAALEPEEAKLRAQLKIYEADAAKARLDVARTEIKAPFDADVESKDVDMGEIVSPGQLLMRLVSLDRLEVPLELPGSRVNDVAIGASALLEIEGTGNTGWTGTVVRKSPVIDDRNRTFSAFIQIENDSSGPRLRPGTFLVAQLEGPFYENVLTIPRGAFVGESVYVFNSGTAHRRIPDVLRTFGDLAIIGSGVNVGDLVILTNLDEVYDGSSVRIGDPQPWSRQVRKDSEEAPVVSAVQKDQVREPGS